MPLSDEAREAVREAVNIIREDRFEKFVRSRMAKEDEPSNGKGKNEPGKGTPPPPPKTDPVDPPAKRGAWWGDVFTNDTPAGS